MIVLANLLKNFEPAFIFEKNYLSKCRKNVNKVEPFFVAIKKDDNNIYAYKTEIITTKEHREETLKYIERIVKCLLWMRGGRSFIIYTPQKEYFNFLKKIYSLDGQRAWDSFFIVKQIYGKDLEFIYCAKEENFPKEKEEEKKLGGYTDGCRIGLDFGGSDKKVSAVENAKVLFTTSIIWNPMEQANINWHRKEIEDVLDLASSYLTRVDAVGISVPGICEKGEVKTSTIFKGLNKEDAIKSRTLLKDMVKEKYNVPFGLANDGDVSALVGALKFKEKNLLAIAMGTSMACGYIDGNGGISDCFNEFAFVPVDYHKDAPNDPWSNDIGCGSQYFSQQAVIRLAKELNLSIDEKRSQAENLIVIQNLVEEENPKAIAIFKTIGIYLAYALMHYRQYYSIDSLLLLGRVLKGKGGEIITKITQETLDNKFFTSIKIYSLSEEDILHAQAITASYIPKLSK